MEQRGRRCHRDFFGHGPDLQDQVHQRLLLNLQRDAAPDGPLEARVLGRNAVVPDCQRDGAIEPRRVSLGPVRNVGVNVGYGYCDARNCGVRGIFHVAHDDALVGLSVGGTGKKEGHAEQSEKQSFSHICLPSFTSHLLAGGSVPWFAPERMMGRASGAIRGGEIRPEEAQRRLPSSCSRRLQVSTENFVNQLEVQGRFMSQRVLCLSPD